MRTVEENDTAYGLNTIRARPVSLVQVRHARGASGGRGASRAGAASDVACTDVACNFEGKSRGHVNVTAATGAALTHDTHESRERHDTQRGVSHKTYSMLCLIACLSQM